MVDTVTELPCCKHRALQSRVERNETLSVDEVKVGSLAILRDRRGATKEREERSFATLSDPSQKDLSETTECW